MMQEMKPALRFEGFDDAWEQRKFSELASLRRGLTYAPTDIRPFGQGVRVLRSSNIDEDKFVLSDNDVFVDEDAVGIDLAQDGEILITAANGSPRLVGKRAVISGLTGKTVHGGFMLCAHAEQPDFVSALMGSRWYRRFLVTGVAGGNGSIGNLDKSALADEDAFAPASDERGLIGTLFSQLDNLITLHQREYDKLLMTKQSLLQKMFPKAGETEPELRFEGFEGPWEWRKLGELYIQSGSGGTPTASNPAYYDGPIPFLSIADIEARDITSTKKTLTELGLQNSVAWLVPTGAIALAMYASVGKVGIIRQDTATSQAFFNMVFDSDIIRDFVYYRLEKAELFEEWEPFISTGTQRNLNAEKVQQWKLQIPGEDEMQAIGLMLASLDNLISLRAQELEKLKQIKSGLLQRMFV